MGKLLPMRKFRDILVAFDGSDSSKNALRQTIRFTKMGKCGGDVMVVTAIPSYEGEIELIGMRNIKRAFREPGEKILSEAMQIARDEGAFLPSSLEEGNIHEVIIDVATSHDVDLIIMGRRGLGNIERAFMGSITARVIGYSPIDVLVMPHDSSISFDTILLAVDGSRYSDIAANRAISMAQLCGGEIIILSVVDVSDEFFAQAPDAVEKMIEGARSYVDSVKEKAASAGIKAKTYVREGETHKKILSMADELNADTICMGSHGRTGLRRLLMGSTTEKVIGSAKCPVLVVKSN